MTETNKPTCGDELSKDILIVEDSKVLSGLLSRAASSELGLEAKVCQSYKEAEEHLKDCPLNHFAALLDLNLPDAPNGEIVDLVTSKNIPAVIFTGELSDDLRDTMWSKGIVDYVIKDNLDNISQIMNILKRLQLSRETNVLIADDSTMSRNLIRNLLSAWKFNIYEAEDGQEALDIIKDRGDINLLITDYNMPRKDGIALVKEVRRIYSKSRLPIIGLSGVGGAATSAHFIKSGANDYMHKPFLTEELYCRVISNIETSEYIATIKEMAERDFLTGIFNRRSFFSYGNKLFSSYKRGQINLALAMFDIDQFKHCNDTYGHDAGDKILRFVAETLTTRFRATDLVARIGGEEFCVACVDLDPERVEQIFEETRCAIEEAVTKVRGREVRVTISIGVCVRPEDTLEEMLKTADDKLYEAKKNGRNQVRIAH